MLEVTEKAAAVLDKTLKASRENRSAVLRLVRSEQGMGLAMSQEEEGDHIVKYGGRKILAIDPDFSQALGDATIDAVDTPEGLALALLPPGAQQPMSSG